MRLTRLAGPCLELNKQRWRYFRWTPRTAFISFMYAIAVPSVTAYLFWKTDVSL